MLIKKYSILAAAKNHTIFNDLHARFGNQESFLNLMNESEIRPSFNFLVKVDYKDIMQLFFSVIGLVESL